MASKSRIHVDQLANEILRTLEEYTGEVIEAVDEAGEELSDEGVRQLKATSPKRRGRYARSWRVKREERVGSPTRFIIHNPTHYRLTHLLEHGHAKRGGGRVAGQPHIAPVERMIVDGYIKAVEGAIKRGH